MSYPFDFVENGVPRNIKTGIEEQEDFFDVMGWRIRHDRSNIIVIVGEQGSGKSNTGLYLSSVCNKIFYKKEFEFEKHIYNNIEDFVKAFNTLKDCYVLLEEVGVELNSKDWRSASNRVFRDIIETFRIRHISLILTLPSLMDLDKSTRFLSHFIVKMNYPSNCIIFRKLTSFLTDKIRFMPVWSWDNVPDLRLYNKKLWVKYEKYHEEYLNKKHKDWVSEINFKNLQTNYRREWYKQRSNVGVWG